MKNKSWQYPFETLDDKMFDKNKDGKLDSFETFFRDMHLNEMNQKTDEYCKKESERKQHTVYNKDIPTTNTNENKNSENNTSGGVQLFVILLVIVVLIGGFILALSAEATMFIRAVIIFAAVAISISLLKFAGLFK